MSERILLKKSRRQLIVGVLLLAFGSLFGGTVVAVIITFIDELEAENVPGMIPPALFTATLLFWGVRFIISYIKRPRAIMTYDGENFHIRDDKADESIISPTEICCDASSADIESFCPEVDRRGKLCIKTRKEVIILSGCGNVRKAALEIGKIVREAYMEINYPQMPSGSSKEVSGKVFDS